jgi:transcriptional regulator of acetoin/glycerol metabolism
MPAETAIRTREAWDRYVANDAGGLQLVRPEVATSWQRCRGLGVNPYQEPETSLDPADLHQRLHLRRNLLTLARPFMENLYNFVRGSGFEVILTDDAGILLNTLGDNDIVDRSREVHLCPGSDWSEAIRGTNAIGTAIVEKRPVQIYAWEHYCQPHHFLTCSAAPIFDVDGAILGVLDVSGDYRFANPHTLGMVVAAVNAIESQLRVQRMTNKLYRSYRYSNILLENMSDGLISIDNHGIVTELNARGAELLGVKPALAKGCHVSGIHDAGPAILPVLSAGPEQEETSVLVHRLGRELRSSASRLRDENGTIIGAVAVLHDPGRQPLRRLSAKRCPGYTFDDIVGRSPAIVALKDWARLAAASPFTVLISGETGTGKELFAQAIHADSPRADRPFIAINCGAMPEYLVESELFGYEEGAFTGASKGGKPGKFECADGGTVFLDEIGDMPLSTQMKLLRVIQERKISRVGSLHEKQVDVRIVVATNKDLLAEVKRGNFREDLYYRLNVLVIHVPPLREHMEDVPLLATHLARKVALRFAKTPARLSEDFLRKLQLHNWPGNIRELENVIERAVLHAGTDGVLNSVLEGDVVDLPLHAEIAVESKPPDVRPLHESEKDLVLQALAANHGEIKKTAAALQIGRNTLYRKLKEYGVAG